MRIFGFPTLPIAAVAEARRTPKTYEISLIVDVTGSMRGAAMNSLRQASRAFVNALLPEATESDRILINLVPYNSSVNIGRARGEWLGPLPTAPTGPAGSARFANKLYVGDFIRYFFALPDGTELVVKVLNDLAAPDYADGQEVTLAAATRECSAFAPHRPPEAD
jgi:hypothetical protein